MALKKTVKPTVEKKDKKDKTVEGRVSKPASKVSKPSSKVKKVNVSHEVFGDEPAKPGLNGYAQATRRRVKDLDEIPENELDDFHDTGFNDLRKIAKDRAIPATGTKVDLWLRLYHGQARVKEPRVPAYVQFSRKRVQGVEQIPTDEIDAFHEAKVVDLKDKLQAKGLDNTGNKVVLWLRLYHDQEPADKPKKNPGGPKGYVNATRNRVKGIERVPKKELEQFHEMHISDIKNELKDRNLDTSGGKVDCWLRLTDNLSDSEDGASDDELNEDYTSSSEKEEQEDEDEDEDVDVDVGDRAQEEEEEDDETSSSEEKGDVATKMTDYFIPNYVLDESISEWRQFEEVEAYFAGLPAEEAPNDEITVRDWLAKHPRRREYIADLRAEGQSPFESMEDDLEEVPTVIELHWLDTDFMEALDEVWTIWQIWENERKGPGGDQVLLWHSRLDKTIKTWSPTLVKGRTVRDVISEFPVFGNMLRKAVDKGLIEFESAFQLKTVELKTKDDYVYHRGRDQDQLLIRALRGEGGSKDLSVEDANRLLEARNLLDNTPPPQGRYTEFGWPAWLKYHIEYEDPSSGEDAENGENAGSSDESELFIGEGEDVNDEEGDGEGQGAVGDETPTTQGESFGEDDYDDEVNGDESEDGEDGEDDLDEDGDVNVMEELEDDDDV